MIADGRGIVIAGFGAPPLLESIVIAVATTFIEFPFTGIGAVVVRRR